jgi:hypothetical protein
LQAAAQATAAEAAAEGLAGSLKAAEARCTALSESVAELQEALERQRAAADLREEMLRQVGLWICFCLMYMRLKRSGVWLGAGVCAGRYIHECQCARFTQG